MCTLINSLNQLNNYNIVYFYIKRGQILYIGKTKNINRRHSNHKEDEYSQMSDTLLLYCYDTYLDASLAELYYINLKYPSFNIRDQDLESYFNSYKHKEYFDNLCKAQYYFIINHDIEPVFKEQKTTRNKKQGIYQVDLKEDKVISFFETQKQALEAINKVGHTGISDAINERDNIKTHIAFGYRWYYKEDLPFNFL